MDKEEGVTGVTSETEKGRADWQICFWQTLSTQPSPDASPECCSLCTADMQHTSVDFQLYEDQFRGCTLNPWLTGGPTQAPVLIARLCHLLGLFVCRIILKVWKDGFSWFFLRKKKSGFAQLWNCWSWCRSLAMFKSLQISSKNVEA